MKNETKKTPALDLVPPSLKKGNAEIINGKLAPKYTSVYILQSVYCENCKNIVAPNGLSYATNVPQLQDLAEAMHLQGITNSRILCASPKLLIIWGNGFLNSSVM